MRLLGHGEAGGRKSSAVRFNKGDVLYGRLRPYLNKVWLAEFDGLCSAEFLVFPKTEGLNSQLFAWRLNAHDFMEFADRQVSGERPRVGFEKLAKFSYLLAPACEQERIVAKLDALLSKIAAGEAAARRALSRTERYRAAVLQAAVTGELSRHWRKTNKPTESGAKLLKSLLLQRRVRWEEAKFKSLHAADKPPKDDKWKKRYPEPQPPNSNSLPKLPRSWTYVSIDQLGWTSGYGTSVKCRYEAKGPAVLRIPNIRNRELDFKDLKFATSSKDIPDKDFVAPGDLLLIRTNGSLDLIGRAAVTLTAPQRKCGFASYLIRYRLLGNRTLWSWVSITWDSDMTRSAIPSCSIIQPTHYAASR